MSPEAAQGAEYVALLKRCLGVLDVLWRGDDYISPESAKAMGDEIRAALGPEVDHPYTPDSLGPGCVCGLSESEHSDGDGRVIEDEHA